MIILYLLLGHLIADFLLQPSRLIVLKIKGWYGILLHVVIHLAVLLFLLLPYFENQIYFTGPDALNQGYFPVNSFHFSPQLNIVLAVIMIIVSHFIIDYFKILYEKKRHKYVFSYWIDQLSHYIVIIGASLLTLNIQIAVPAHSLSKGFLAIYLSPYWLLYAIGALFVTFTLEIGFFESKREHQPDFVLHFNKKAMLKRLMFFSLLFVVLSLMQFVF